MPCNSDHMNPQTREIELSRVACLIGELNGVPIDPQHWEGTHPEVYCQNLSKAQADDMVSMLCGVLKGTDVTKYSLEMQLWWRDHQAADKTREEKARATRNTMLFHADKGMGRVVEYLAHGGYMEGDALYDAACKLEKDITADLRRFSGATGTESRDTDG